MVNLYFVVTLRTWISMGYKSEIILWLVIGVKLYFFCGGHCKYMQNDGYRERNGKTHWFTQHVLLLSNKQQRDLALLIFIQPCVCMCTCARLSPTSVSMPVSMFVRMRDERKHRKNQVCANKGVSPHSGLLRTTFSSLNSPSWEMRVQPTTANISVHVLKPETR
jgi:hypothetical protein